MRETVRIVLVDDSQFLLTVLVTMLENHPDLTVVGTAVNGLDAL